MDQKIGQMDPAYFLGRREILDFINTTCDSNLAKVEQTCSGAIACQLLDAIYPGKVPMSKVDWGAKNTYQYSTNYKVLQNCFAKLGIDKPIGVEKLSRGRYQDNLEFMQWFKAFYDLNGNPESDYDGYAKRCKGKGGSVFLYNNRGASANAVSGTTAIKKKPIAARTTTPAVRPTSRSSSHMQSSTRSGNNNNGAKEESEAKDEKHGMVISQLEKQNEELETRNVELVETLQGLEKERDFYFNKLRHVEVFLQEQDDAENQDSMVKKVLDILYAPDEAEGENIDGKAAQDPVDADGEEQNGQKSPDVISKTNHAVPEEEVLEEEEPVITD